MKKLLIGVCVVAFALTIAACGGGVSTSSGKTLVTVNGVKITEGDLNFLGKINPRIEAQLANPAGKKRILDNLVEQELLYQEAEREGVNRDPEVRAKADLYRRVIVAQSLLEKEADVAAKKYYDEHSEEFQKLKLSQIMIRYQNPTDKAPPKNAKAPKVRTEAEALKFANEVKARLDKGEAFDAVAKETSDDVATKGRGGDMGPVSKNDPRFTQRGYGPLVEKAFEMKVGEISGPIKTEKGYHIITVTAAPELEAFDKAKNEILMKMRGEQRNELLARLKKDGKVTYSEEFEPKPAEQKPGEGGAAPAEGAAAAPVEGAPAMTPEAGAAGAEKAAEAAKPGEPQAKVETKPAAEEKPATLSGDTTVKVKVNPPKDAPKKAE